jgi:hypothetical protein
MFKSFEDHRLILSRDWSWGPTELLLHLWDVHFDPRREPVSTMVVWVILLGLLLVFWDKNVLKFIGNKVGDFIRLEKDWYSNMDQRWAWVEVEVDIKKGLLEEIELVFENFSWVQHIDYWCIPFLCFECHVVSHTLEICPSSLRLRPSFKNIWNPKEPQP